MRYEDALTALELHHHLLDSLQNANKGHKIAVLQNSYELAESRLHIESLKFSNQGKTYQRNLSFMVIATILLILLVVAGYFYKTRRLNRRLESSNLIKDKLFSIIGHDLRNPIGGITQLLAIMEEEKLGEEEYRHMVTEMKDRGTLPLKY